MNKKYIDEIVLAQRQYFNEGNTLPIKMRINVLKKLYKIIKENEKEICNALTMDLGKSDLEGFMCEVGLVLSEITYMIKHIRKFSKAKKVHTPISQFPAKSYKKKCPFGNVLIISPWNYPFLLTIQPLVDAIAAGNTAIIKPSEVSPFTSNIIAKIINCNFSKKHIHVVLGGVEECTYLLENKFDLVFYTGNEKVAKIVLNHTNKYLTPTILELGGKSPCIVDNSAKIKLAAKRIVFGKFLNCGQTCVAPDYILCQKDIKEELIKEIKKQIVLQFKDNPLKNNDYGKIINERHFDRILNLVNKEKIIFGGKTNKTSLKIEPTIMDNVKWDDLIMSEEIFGPILPILTFDDFDDLYTLLLSKPKPLALYLFSTNKKHIDGITSRIPYGGGCINDTVIHLATSELGFGGIGNSGMGSYHGIDGFNAFSHTKNILNKKNWLDLPMRYQPYKKGIYKKLIHYFLK